MLVFDYCLYICTKFCCSIFKSCLTIINGFVKLNLQQLRDACQEEDIDHSGLHRKKDLIERINEVREAQAAVEDDDGEDEAEFDENAASVASRSVYQNGGANCSREEFTDILRLRLQLKLSRTEKEKVEAEERRVQAEQEMMRKRFELGFQGEEMRAAGAFATKSLPEIKFQKWLNRRVMFCHFLMFFEKTCTLHGIQGQQVASILPSLLNEKANKIYSRLNIDTCRRMILSKQRS